MSERLDENRLRDALRASETDARPGSACPTPERLLAAASGELPPESTRAVVEHTAACGACSESWRIAAEVADAAGSARRAMPRGMAPWLALAATVAAAALIVFTLPERRAPEFRDLPAPAEIRTLVPDGAALPRGGFALAWSPVDGAVAYDLEVAAADLTPLDRVRGLTAASHRVPAEALAAVPDGGTVVWRVVARLPDGREVRSAAFLARVEGAAAP